MGTLYPARALQTEMPQAKEVQNCRLFLKGACSKKTYGDLSSSLEKKTEFALKSEGIYTRTLGDQSHLHGIQDCFKSQTRMLHFLGS